MTSVDTAFALVVESDDIRQRLPDWPEHLLLATTIRATGPETHVFSPEDPSLRSFIGSLPVVPARMGFELALPSFEEEEGAWAATISQAHSLLDAGEVPLPGAASPDEDRFADLEEATEEEVALPRYWMRRVRGGFEIRASTMPMFPWGVDRVSIGASTLGIHPIDQPLDRTMTFSVTAEGNDTISAVARFLPTTWREVPLVQGSAGVYFDVSSIMLTTLSDRTRFAIRMAISGAIAGAFTVCVLLSMLMMRL